MSIKAKTRAISYLKLLPSILILTAVPRLGVAQSCAEAPVELEAKVTTIGLAFTNAHLESLTALTRFHVLLGKPKKQTVGYDGFFEGLLVNEIIARLPGANLAKSTMIGFYQNAKNSREARGLNERLADHDWLDAELAKLSAVYEFKDDLQCQYANAYADLESVDEQQAFLSDLEKYSQSVRASKLKQEEVYFDILVRWINNNYEDKRQLSKGLLVLRVKVNDGVIAKSNPKLEGPSASDDVAKKLNELMATSRTTKRPFDLMIRKMILIRGTIKGCTTCDVMFMLDKRNRFIEYPTYKTSIDARGVYERIRQNNFGSYNVKFGN